MGAAERALYQHLIQSGRHELRQVARRLNMPYSTLAAYCEDRRPLRADMIPLLYSATHDIDLFADVSGASACGIVCSLPAQGRLTGESIAVHMLRVEAEVGVTASEVIAAVQDGRVDQGEAARILAKIPDCERALAELRSALQSIAKIRHVGSAGA